MSTSMGFAGGLQAPLAWLAIFVFAASLEANAAGLVYRIDPQRSTAGFTAYHLGFIGEHGQFNSASGTIVIDSAGAAGGSIEVVVDLSSVDTGWALRDDFLRGATMFDVARYPIMRFRSRRLDYRDGRVVGAEGEVALHGVTRALRLDVRELICSASPVDGHEVCSAMVTGHVLRRDFGIGFAYPLLGDEVDLEFAITASRVGDETDSERP